MANEQSEEERIIAAKAGDSAALGELLFSTYDDLARFLQQKMPAASRRHLDAEDVIQQVFTQAFREIQQFEYRGSGSLGAWLRTIADFRLKDAIKHLKAKKRGGDQVLVSSQSDSFLDVMTAIASDDPTASQIVRHAEARRATRLAIAQLPEDYQTVIRLRFFELKSIDETSRLMSRTPASVRSLADRAKKQLRESLVRFSIYLSSRG